jgi:hypothetical protein
MFKKDHFIYGAVLGFAGPVIGLLIFKLSKFAEISFADTIRYMYMEQGHRTLSVALSLALLANALLFTIFVNARKDKTAKGIFAFTCVYGILILLLKTIS